MGIDTLNPSLPLIEDIVKPFLPNLYQFQYAVNATREIVNGFKYEIIFVMKNEDDNEVYCLMDVLEKPWLIKDAIKFRKMIYNNCSLLNPSDDEDRMRFEYEINPVFNNQGTDLTEEDMRYMEDQIITDKSLVETTPPAVEPIISTTSIDDVTLSPLDPSSRNILDDFFNMNHYFPQPQISTPVLTTTTTTTTSMTSAPLSDFNMSALDGMFGMRKKTVENSQAQPTDDSSSSSASNDDEELQQRTNLNSENYKDRNDESLKELEAEIKRAFSELFQSDPDFRMNIIALINRNDDSTAQKNYNYVVNILASKLKDKIESYNERRHNRNHQENENENDRQFTVDPNEQIILNRKRRSLFNLISQEIDHFVLPSQKVMPL